jgi:phosphoribosylglycinamide formyltransferase 2
MVTLGTPLSPHATRVLLLGAGELGKEVALELQRLGVEVIAAGPLCRCPAMQVAHRSHVLDMLDGVAIRALIAEERPHLIVPEIEAIHTETLVELEREFSERGTQTRIIPTARATRLTMDREGIRRLAARRSGCRHRRIVSSTRSRNTETQVATIDLPCVVKPLMSSSGHGQSLVRTADDIDTAWDYAQTGGRAGAGTRHRRGLHRLRLRDHPADRATCRLVPISVSPSATCSAMAITERAGNRSRWRRARWRWRRGVARSITDELGRMGCVRRGAVRQGRRRCGSRRSRRVRTTPAWSRSCRRT